MLNARIFAGGALLGLAAATISGCGNKPRHAKTLRQQIQKKLADQVKPEQTLDITMQNNNFTVDDEKGFRLLEAQMQQAEGQATPGKGLQGLVKMKTAKCRLFKAGKLQMTLESPEATWDGLQLVSDKPVHAVSAGNDKIIDAQKSVWHAKEAKLDLDTAKMQSVEKGKVTLVTDAPAAFVQDNIATMPKGAVGKTPDGDTMKGNTARWLFTEKRLEAKGNVVLTNAQGKQCTSDSMKWALDTGAVEADGNVVLTEEGTRVTGQRLRGNTKLQKGRLSGRSRVVMTGSPLKKKPR
jgi:hypothetical protein